ncbi:MAG: exodeoxyribonuclease VII large subunit [Bacteroidales bacterium]|nr:exodeoxyribonuclease VII large subunit [Bacteroidales bacterium]
MTEKLSLTELQLLIRDSLYITLPDTYWVIAEISEIRENFAGHCYLELIEKNPDEKNVRARAKAIIWNNRYRFLRPLFENMTGQSLRQGLKILIRVRIDYHELYGLSLVISDIDPSFTLGEMALKRQQIIKRLEDEGVFNMNKELDFPLVPQKIAIVSSRSAAGYSDFLSHIAGNSYRYIFYTALFETIMQGTDTEKSVIRSLDRIAGYNDLFDVVVIIRGGGSQTDLSWFDNYNIAYHITQFPLPVLTGIGHEKDLSVTDMVAFESLKTPTAVADYLIEHIAATENRLVDMSSAITTLSGKIIEVNRTRIETCRLKLIPVARMMISDIKEELSGRLIEITNTGKEIIGKAALIPAYNKSRLISATRSVLERNQVTFKQLKQNLISYTSNSINSTDIKLNVFASSLKILNPENVLKRGYTITSMNGRIIKSSGLVNENDIIDTTFSDGRIKSRVIRNKV